MIIPYDFYYSDSNDNKNLDKVYHNGQMRIWDGKEVLTDLFAKYENTEIDADKKESLTNILSVILWGEYIAWNVASEMSAQFEQYGAKMAAVSQAHDEARHFYVIRDYLRRRLNYTPSAIFAPVLFVLEEVSKANSLAKKLLGMQLMVEPIAITIFRFIRKSNVDPILTELLEYFEKDEARHIALGVKYLPNLIKEMGMLELCLFLWWQIKLINAEIKGLKAIEEDLIVLGLSPLEVFNFAEAKQFQCLKEISREMKIDEKLWVPVMKIVQFRKKMAFYPHANHNLFKKIINSIFEIIQD
tara:strand:+ start:3268 stop:4167 length:900 start_codon:yes stop_codon:yes gene_type:complete